MYSIKPIIIIVVVVVTAVCGCEPLTKYDCYVRDGWLWPQRRPQLTDYCVTRNWYACVWVCDVTCVLQAAHKATNIRQASCRRQCVVLIPQRKERHNKICIPRLTGAAAQLAPWVAVNLQAAALCVSTTSQGPTYTTQGLLHYPHTKQPSFRHSAMGNNTSRHFEGTRRFHLL